jgi:DNA-binding response OmpR family regulator
VLPGETASSPERLHNGAVRVLIVEDDPAVADGIADGLASGAFQTSRAGSGAEALEALARFAPEVVLMDLGLPDIDGTDLCRRIRATSGVPIIVVSARGEELDRVLALELGADDYLVKPFGMRELLARIRAVTRRTGAGAPEPAALADPVQRIGQLAIDRRGRRVRVAEVEVHLTPTEFDLLDYLASEPGAVLRRTDILREVWHTEWYGAAKTLDAHVAALRRKLGHPGWIQAVRGVGFRFEQPT